LAVVGFWAWWRMKQMGAEWAVCLWAFLSFFLFNGSSVMWEGGFSIGPRYLAPMLPFLVMGLGAFAARWGKTLWARGLTLLLAVWSILVIWAETIGGQNYPDWTLVPLINYSLPKLMAGDIARNLGMALGLRGWDSLIPLGLFLVVMLGLLIWQLQAKRAERAGELTQTHRRLSDEATQA
ncbi:MAG: hypothetical protein HYR94_08860, partial [Chloroflexi bacterium]|nr:hypothetical protein [Chloroflexota bacterium]